MISYVKYLLCLLYVVTSFCVADQSPWFFTPQDVNSLHSKYADYKLFYGKNDLQFGELRLPEGKGPFPVIIVIHGGCWISKLASLQNTSALADALRNAGYATWNIEYRRIDNEGGGWPGTFLDVANATDFLRTIASQYSLALNHIVAIGHSAGGHLSLWLAMRHKLKPDSDLYMKSPLPIQGVISLGGVPDLKAFREQGEKVCGQDVVGELLGSTPESIDQHYTQASPVELLPSGVQQILLFGKEDKAVPINFGQSYSKKAEEKGEKVRVIEIPGAAHHEYNVPNSIAWPRIVSSLQLLK